LPKPTQHPASFPVALPTFYIRSGGTGTTAVAAEKPDRRWLVSEFDERVTVVGQSSC